MSPPTNPALSHTMKWTPTNQADEGPVPSGDGGTLSPDSSRSDSSSLTDRWQGQQGFLDVILCPSLQCIHHASLSICQRTDTHQMTGGRGNGGAVCVHPPLWSTCTEEVSVSDGLVLSRMQHLAAEWTKVTSEGDRASGTKIETKCCSTPCREPCLLMTPHTRWESLQSRVKYTIRQVSLESPTESWEPRLGRQHTEMCW